MSNFTHFFKGQFIFIKIYYFTNNKHTRYDLYILYPSKYKESVFSS